MLLQSRERPVDCDTVTALWGTNLQNCFDHMSEVGVFTGQWEQMRVTVTRTGPEDSSTRGGGGQEEEGKSSCSRTEVMGGCES